MEAEYIALANEDNQSAICLAMQEPSVLRARKTHWNQVSFRQGTDKEGYVELSYCRTEEMVADMLTKGLGREQLRKLRKMSGLGEMPSCSTCE